MSLKSKDDQEISARLLKVLMERLRDAPSQISQERFIVQLNGVCTRDAYGFTHADPDVPGKYQFRGQDETGQPLQGNVYVDSQCESPVSVSDSPQIEYRTARECSTDESLRMSDRIPALRRWLSDDPEAASVYILDCLSKQDITGDFRDNLVFLAEDARYYDASQRERLAEELKRIALQLIVSNGNRSEQVVCSAIRRYASLLPVEQLSNVAEFLHNTGGPDTRIVALQGLLHALEVQPVGSECLAELKDRVYAIVSKLIDADVLNAGVNSVIVECGICVLFASNDPRAEECLSQVRDLNWDWLTTQVRGGLRELLESLQLAPNSENVLAVISKLSTAIEK